MKKTLLQFIFTLCVAITGVVGYFQLSAFWLPFEYKIKDLMFLVRGPIQGNENIVIIDIDEKSLKTLGQWPWSRDKVAHLLQNLTDYGVAIIGLDIVFAEPDNSSPKKVFEKMGLNSENVVDYDALLAHTIAQSPTVIGYVFALQPDGVTPEERTPVSKAIVIEQNKPEDSNLIKPYRAILNIPSIHTHAYSSGYFNTIPDRDGIVRSIPLVMNYNNIIYPSLSLEMMRIIMDEKKISLIYDERGISHITLGTHTIPTDYHGRLYINYRGAQNSYRYISAADIYSKTANALHVEGKIALIGTSAAGLLDLRSTPYDSAYPGVEVHANALDNMLSQAFIAKPIWAVGVDIVSIVLIAFVTFGILLLPSALGTLLALIGTNAILFIAHYTFMTSQGIVFNTIVPLGIINALFLIGQALNYFLEIKQKEMVKSKFARKVSPAVMNDLLKNTRDIFEGREKEITVFFSDVRNFTRISEAMGDPKHLIHFMNAYMDPMSEIIIQSGGTVDKFIGDAIMAYWNAPLDMSDHAEKAVMASLQQLHRLKQLNETLRLNPEFTNVVSMADTQGIPIIDIGIGLNTGLAIAGEMGSTHRSDYTVIGDAINLGSRLESLCKYYHSHLTLSHFTKEKLKGAYIFRFLDLVTVKGKNEPVEIWQIHDFDTEMDTYLFNTTREAIKNELSSYHEAIDLYKKSSFQEALTLFQTLDALENKTNNAIYSIYIQRCLHYIEIPPQDFNGVYVHTTKG
ncbi:MAG: adenylate cyclase [Sulfurovum sp. FS06-10]|nr:MAG: adenylate cyclase [Sulfurovum sp. FS06-10]